MLILTIRTDNPEAEVGLFENQTKAAYKTWHAHRELSTTIHAEIEAILKTHGKSLQDVQGIVCFQGPGSFTGLRMGLTVANVLAYGLGIPIVATMDEGWVIKGIQRLQAGEDDKITLPHYGAPVHVTLPKA
ncbi:MAG TPA: tRNA (adenosine(37)-N6)-threonylcarbamoyltransferase complex dimerization subunit type 1 TsaB [Candidatus Saccharimonadales bacterium]|nr:tRNA (adenosine(37)-N6)-threonylcarbamoyltransferase complex dimerization subunit type 1 TsaB [Candidatus Saccharimonadales bacterium]